MAALVVVGCINEVTALGVVAVENGEDFFLGHGTRETSPEVVLVGWHWERDGIRRVKRVEWY